MAGILAGDADNRVGPEQRAGLPIGHILGTDMHAINFEFLGEINIVVEEKGDIRRLGNREKTLGRFDNLFFRTVFQAQLETGDIAA